MNRVARNVSSIILEEAHLNMVADPAAGAFAIENIVDNLAEAAWKQFQSDIKQS
jgi:methylmalonyl-CoA mutase